MKSTIGAIILFVFDINKEKAFYRENFGLDTVEDSPGWVVLKGGSVELGLHQIPAEYGPYTPSEEETNVKLVFDIQEDIHQARQTFIEKQISIGDIKTWEGYPFWVCDGKDPEGNVFQLRLRK
jgi:catechol 2,3-dioxygenase-like lactoylglutathione lyase family enzyme